MAVRNIQYSVWEKATGTVTFLSWCLVSVGCYAVVAPWLKEKDDWH